MKKTLASPSLINSDCTEVAGQFITQAQQGRRICRYAGGPCVLSEGIWVDLVCFSFVCSSVLQLKHEQMEELPTFY